MHRSVPDRDQTRAYSFAWRMDDDVNHQPAAITGRSATAHQAMAAWEGEVDDRDVARWMMELMPDVTLDASMYLVRIDAQAGELPPPPPPSPHHDNGEGDIYVFLGAFMRPEDVSYLRETEEVTLQAASRRAAALIASIEEMARLGGDGDQERFLFAGFGPAGGGGSGPVAVPASAAAIASLENLKYGGSGGGDVNYGTNSDSTGCVICFQDYEVGDELAVMPCSGRHRFHRKCAAEWLARSRLCPLCRHALPAEEQDESNDRTTFRFVV